MRPSSTSAGSVVTVASPAITLVTATGAVLIVLGYLPGVWLDGDARGFVLEGLSRWVSRPLGLGEDLGALGVMLLLAASGYATMSRAKLAHVVAAVVIGTAITTAVPPIPAAPSEGLLDHLLQLSRSLSDDVVLHPLAWVALLAIMGRMCLLVVTRIPRRLRWLGYAAQLILAVDLTVVGLATGLNGLAFLAPFYAVVVAGQIVRGVRTGSVPAWVGALAGLAAYLVVAIADHFVTAYQGWWYPLAAIYAGLGLAIAVTFAGNTAARVAASKPVRWSAERVWWIGALSTAVGLPVATWLATTLPAGIALLGAILAVAVAVELAYRLIGLVPLGPRRPRQAS